MALMSEEMLRGYVGGLRWAYYENDRRSLAKEIESADANLRGMVWARERAERTVPQGNEEDGEDG